MVGSPRIWTPKRPGQLTMALQRNPFKHQLQGQVYKEAWDDLRARMRRYVTVPVRNGVVKAANAPETVYAVKLGKRLVHDAFTSLDEAKVVAQGIANKWDVPIEIVDKRNGAFVAQRGSTKRSAATFGMSKNPRRQLAGGVVNCWVLKDGHGRIIARADTKAALLRKLQKRADATRSSITAESRD